MPAPIINDPTKELGYVAQRSSLWVLGKQSAELVGENLGRNITDEGARNFASAAGSLSGIGGLIMIGIAGAVSAGLTQMDHIHRKENLKEFYKEELSSKLNKPIEQLSRSDLNVMAKGNGVIDEEMARNRKQRNFGVVLSLVASMASLAVITLALPAIPLLAPLLAAETTLALVGAVALKAVVGLTTYNLVKAPLHSLADKLFNIDEKTTNDYIVNIKRERDQGKVISREQVMSVFVASNPELDKYIVAEYGKHYDDLDLAGKQQVTKELAGHLPLDKLTIEINSGKVNVSELAFAVEGQKSGVNHEKFIPEAPKPGLMMSMFKGMGHMLGFKSHTHDHDHEMSVKAIAGATAVAVSHHSHAPAEKGFAAERAPHKTHVEHLEQTRSDAAMNLGLPS